MVKRALLCLAAAVALLVALPAGAVAYGPVIESITVSPDPVHTIADFDVSITVANRDESLPETPTVDIIYEPAANSESGGVVCPDGSHRSEDETDLECQGRWLPLGASATMVASSRVDTAGTYQHVARLRWTYPGATGYWFADLTASFTAIGATWNGDPTWNDGTQPPPNDGNQIEAAPAITKYSLSPTTFRAAKKGAMMTKARIGTTVTFGLSKAATATFTVQKAVTGRLVGKVCKPVTKGNRKRHKCTRWVAVAGAATEAGKSGTNRCGFTGRVKGRALKPGTYRLGITAKTARSAASKPRTAGFKIVG